MAPCPKFALALTLAVCGAFAQRAPRLVTLQVNATDAQGRPVTDLTAAELQITDQGKAQTIAAFHNLGGQAAAAPLGPREFSNRPGPGRSGAVAVLFDLLNLELTARQTTSDEIIRGLEALEAADSVYLYLLNTSGELVAVRGAGSADTASWNKDARALLEKAMGPVANVQSAMQRDTNLRIKTTYAALEKMAAKMAAVPGRSNILWITNGVPRSFAMGNGDLFDLLPHLRQSAANVDRAGVAIYPVLMVPPDIAPPNVETLEEFASMTGGKVDLGRGIARDIGELAMAARSAYRVQYAPPEGFWDGKFHKVHVGSTRGGVIIRAEQGYTAEKQEKGAADADRDATAMQNAFDVNDIGMRVAASPGAQPHTLHLQIALDGSDLRLQPQDDHFVVQLTFLFGATLPDGRLQGYAPVPVNLSLQPAQRDRILRDGMKLAHDLTTSENATKVRLLVVDRNGNQRGSVTIPLPLK